MTTLTFSVKTNITEMAPLFDKRFRSQVAYATALALTNTAWDVQREETAAMSQVFYKPTPFTMRAMKVIRAEKTRLTSSVYIQPLQAKYLAREIAGGEQMPTHIALPVPVDVELNMYGGMPRTIVKRLLKQPNVFSGTVHGHPGIYQRKGKEVILLIGWAPKWKYEARFDFVGIAKRIIAARFNINMREAWARAVATAR